MDPAPKAGADIQAIVMKYDRCTMQVSRGIEESQRRALNLLGGQEGNLSANRERMNRSFPGKGMYRGWRKAHVEVNSEQGQFCPLKCLETFMITTTGMGATGI